MKKLTLRDKLLLLLTLICVVVSIVVLSTRGTNGGSSIEVEEVEEDLRQYLYGVCIDSLDVYRSEVKQGETLSTLLDKYGVSQTRVNQMVVSSKEIFDERTFRGGNKYAILSTPDSLSEVKYFIYEINRIDYIVYNLSDTITAAKGAKDVVTNRLHKEGVIESSLWNAMVDQGVNATLATSLSDVYQWSIDFFAIQKGDRFNVVYEEQFVEDKSIGIGTIYGAIFEHGSSNHYAIRFEYEDDKGETVVGYWDEEGKSLRSMFLKAPLNYSRISSRFSNSRYHPVLRISRPHHGVDYAAPAGTPVQAIADGVVTFRAYKGQNGNYIRLKHANRYESGYLHLKSFAKGITVGSRVKQGQVIAYVGSTGVSTGPHLDFRIWLASKPIDPLKLQVIKGKDIESKYRDQFMRVRDRIVAELEGREYIEPIIDSLANVDSLKIEK